PAGISMHLVRPTTTAPNAFPTTSRAHPGALSVHDALPIYTLSTAGVLTITDVDQGQSNFAAQASAAGAYGAFTLDAAGHWTYAADKTHTALQQLDAGQSITDSFTAVSSERTSSALVTVTIN